MACCTGQTECNHIITIGYLKTFTNGLIQNGSGVAQDVNLNALPSSARTDSYCPTYAQLTGGSLIPNFVNAGSHKWSQNVDGITINGTYGSTQCVKQEDLVATYTRFETLTITATPSTNISECGGTSRMSYTYTLRKYVKSMNSSCQATTTSSTDTDTTDSGDAAIAYSSNQSWATVSKPTVTLAKNSTHDSPARTVTITGRITFRGTQHSATATIGQKALTGEYKFWYHTYELYSYDRLTVSPNIFNCNGGNWTATGYYTNHDWDVYRWQDSCGVNYDSDTDNRNHTYPSYTETYSTGNVSSIDCETLSTDYTHTETINYHGKTATWTQSCPTCSGDCRCGETCRYETIHSGGTIPCTGGSVDILYDYLVKSVTCDPSTGERTETIVDSGTNVYYTTVSASGCNNTSSPIELEYGVVQEAGPCCCEVGDVVSFNYYVVSCSGAVASTQYVQYTLAHTDADCSVYYSTGFESKSIPSASCNSTGSIRVLQAGNTATTVAAANPRIIQEAGPCCPTCDCTTVHPTVTSLQFVYSDDSTTVKPINFFSISGCYYENLTAEGTSSLQHFNVTVGAMSVSVTPKGTNTTTSPYNESFTLRWDVPSPDGGYGVQCSQVIDLYQSSSGCAVSNCTCYTYSNASIVNPGSLTCYSTSATLQWSFKEYRISIDSACTVTTTEISSSTANTTVTFASNSGGTTSVTRSGNYTWTSHKECGDGYCKSTDIVIPWSLTLPACPTPTGCTCDALTSLTPVQITTPLAQQGVELITIGRNTSCPNQVVITASASQSWITNLSVSGNKILGDITENTDHDNSRSQSISVSVDGTACSAVTVTQPPLPCTCESVDFFVSAATTVFSCEASSDTYIIASADTHGCGTISASTSSAILQEGDVFIDYYVPGDNSKCLIKARGINANPNPDLDRTSGIYLYLANSTLPCDETIKITQLKCAPIVCDCSNTDWYFYWNGSYSDTAATVGCNSGYLGVDAEGRCDGNRIYPKLEVTTDVNWIEVEPSSQDYRVYLNYGLNTGNSDRTAHINVDLYYNDVKCTSTSYTLTQTAYEACTCVSIMNNTTLVGDNYNIEFDCEGNVISGSQDIKFVIDKDALPCACADEDLTITLDDSSIPDWLRVSKSYDRPEWHIYTLGTVIEDKTGTLHFNPPVCGSMLGWNISVAQNACKCTCTAWRERQERYLVDVTVASSTTNYIWDGGYTGCWPQTQITDTDKPSWVNSITFVPGYGIYMRFDSNTGATRSYCFTASFTINGNQCLTKQLCLTQEGENLTCDCSVQDYSLHEENQFRGTACREDGSSFSYNGYDYCYTDQYIGASEQIYRIRKPNSDNPQESCKALDLRCIRGDTNYIGVSLSNFGNYSYVVITILNNVLPANVDSVEVSYLVEVYDKNELRNFCGEGAAINTCTYEEKTFTLYKSYECLDPCYHCDGSETLLTVNTITTAITKSSSENYVNVATITIPSDAKYRCLTIEVSSQQSGVHPRMNGSTLQVWADNDSPARPTVDIYLTDPTGGTLQCQHTDIMLSVS